jgi:hypothetical protein
MYTIFRVDFTVFLVQYCPVSGCVGQPTKKDLEIIEGIHFMKTTFFFHSMISLYYLGRYHNRPSNCAYYETAYANNYA